MKENQDCQIVIDFKNDKTLSFYKFDLL